MATRDSAAQAGTILALDVGKRRIGLAVCDEGRSLVRGLATLYRTRIRDDLDGLASTASEWNASLLLVGKPLHMSGDESRQSEYTREFAERLSGRTGLPIIYWDERLTSAEAERLLRESGTVIDRKGGQVDRIAAVLLLESYLEYLNMLQHETEDK